jgi:prepilin-type N-terminal cleavage/methylation domain-containing protein
MRTGPEPITQGTPVVAWGDGRRPGFSMIELLVTLVVFSVVIIGALNFFSSEHGVFREGAARAEAAQNLHYAASILERDIRTAGTNVPPEQPFLVYAGNDIIAFNADYASNIRNAFSVYYDPDAPNGAVEAIQLSQRIQLPGTSVFYPDVNYTLPGGQLSPAELLIFFFAPDTTTPRPDDYVLYRQVNNFPPEEVARNILRAGNQPFFEYHHVVTTSGAPTVVPVPSSQIPARHVATRHGAPADTGRFAVVDNIRGVRINMIVTNGRTGSHERRLEIHRMIWMRNAGLAPVSICGDPPIFLTSIQALQTIQNGKPVVQLTWLPSVDEHGGEQDVVRYVVWRQVNGNPNRGDPFVSLPAGFQMYTFFDETVEVDSSYVYSVAAQDCTPSMSAPIDSNPVLVQVVP